MEQMMDVLVGAVPADGCSSPARLPQRLAAGEPAWRSRCEVVVIGSGVAGLTAALTLHQRMGVGAGRILVVTKDAAHVGSTHWAQGGVAAALGSGDTPAEHWRDTLIAGAGACDVDAVWVLANEGPDAVRDLLKLGAEFDRGADGRLSLGREGGHRRHRVAHAGGDATGAEIQRTLLAAVEAAAGIEVVDHAFALDLLRAGDGRVCGLTVHDWRRGVGVIHARAVVLATGGLGQAFSHTTNPAVCTADGMAIALRAGATLRDLEFVQFHPTAMYVGRRARGQQPLISEAVRGEGAFLVDFDGRRIMDGVHELADLAPRDVVAKAVVRRMRDAGRDHMWLDGRHLGLDTWNRRFPTILGLCRAHGTDPVNELIPVAPACHHAAGGVQTDLWGRSSVPGLYATGEVACPGVHGANRLASNSLLEGLVFSRRVAQALSEELPDAAEPVADLRAPGVVGADIIEPLQNVMSERVGVLRSAAGLAHARAELGALAAMTGEIGPAGWAATNVLTVSSAIALAASHRRETRGSHWRDDFPQRDDANWAGHLDVTMTAGQLAASFTPGDLSDLVWA